MTPPLLLSAAHKGLLNIFRISITSDRLKLGFIRAEQLLLDQLNVFGENEKGLKENIFSILYVGFWFLHHFNNNINPYNFPSR